MSTEVIKRIIRSALHNYEQTLQSQIFSALSGSTQTALDALLTGSGEDECPIDKGESTQIHMHSLKRDLRGTKLKYLQQANILLDHLQRIGLPTDTMEKIPRPWLKKYALRASTEVPSQLADHPEHTRHTLIASFCFMRLQLLTDQMTA